MFYVSDCDPVPSPSLLLCLGNVISIRDPVTPRNRTEPIRASGKCNPNSFLLILHRRGFILRQGDRIDGCDREKRGVENAHQRPSAAQFIITHTQIYIVYIYIHAHTQMYMCICLYIGAAPALSEINLFDSAPDVAWLRSVSGVPQAQSVKRLHQMMQSVGQPSQKPVETQYERKREGEFRLTDTLYSH